MYKIGNDFVLGFLDFRALIGKFPSWKKKVTSQAKLKIVQLEPWLITTTMAFPVVEFSKEGYKIRKFFG